jgi:hypothetical protein
MIKHYSSGDARHGLFNIIFCPQKWYAWIVGHSEHRTPRIGAKIFANAPVSTQHSTYLAPMAAKTTPFFGPSVIFWRTLWTC